MANYCLYLDDERNPKTNRDWKICRSYQEAVDMILEYGCPNVISFDHDLGDKVPTGYDLAKWLVEEDINFREMGKYLIPLDFDFNVHSANPVGAQNITHLLKNYLGVWQD